MGLTLPILKRQKKRARTWLAGAIGGTDWQQEVRVRDLSEGGALLSCELPPPVDTILNLYCETLEITARVAWVGSHFIGVQFLDPLDQSSLREWIGATFRVAAPRDYSGFDLE